MAKVINLRVENILGISEAEASPNGESFVIGGKNGQGKSSVQKALKMALGGKDFVPAEPTHNGAKKGSVVLELDNGYRVAFAVTSDRKTKLSVTHATNPAFKSDSVTLLKSLFGEMSFDPGEWVRLDNKARLETLLRLAGIDLTELNQRRAVKYEERTTIGRDVKRLEGQLSGLNRHDDAPGKEEDAGELLREISEAQRAVDANDKQLKDAVKEAERAKELTEDLQKLDAEIEALQAKRKQLEHKRDDTADASKRLLEEAKQFEAPDLDGLKARLNGIEDTNRKVRENQQFDKVKTELDEAAESYESLTRAIDSIDEEKRELLTNAKLPVDGLSVDEDAIRFNGVLLSQVSESQTYEVATGIAFALNPQSIVFMSQSGGMDIETRRRVLDKAKSLGVQLAMEVVDDAEDVQIVIEHGKIAENRLEQAGATA